VVAASKLPNGIEHETTHRDMVGYQRFGRLQPEDEGSMVL